MKNSKSTDRSKREQTAQKICPKIKNLKDAIKDKIHYRKKKNLPEFITRDKINALSLRAGCSDETIQAWHRNFLADCPEGKLTRKVFLSNSAILYPTLCPRSLMNLCNRIFDTFDSDKSGYIDFDEFIVGSTLANNGSVREKLQLVFKLYDRNRDGYITRGELRNMLRILYELNGRDMMNLRSMSNELFNCLDIDTDRKISLEEFIYGCETDPHICHLLASSLLPTLDLKNKTKEDEELRRRTQSDGALGLTSIHTPLDAQSVGKLASNESLQQTIRSGTLARISGKINPFRKSQGG
ncbi:hypothetical protein ACOME3_002375 [Neoechinorhynchus agilis]